MEGDEFYHKRFRVSSIFILTEWGQLKKETRKSLSGIYNESDIYGVFQPTNILENRPIKLAYRDVALLYMHLQNNYHLPYFLFQSGNKSAAAIISQMIIDHIIEIEEGESFVGGLMALKLLYGDEMPDIEFSDNKLSLLSKRAIEFAYMLGNSDQRDLSTALYTCNTEPMEASIKLNYIKQQNIYDYLLPPFELGLSLLVSEHWNFSESVNHTGWFSWFSKLNSHNPYLNLSNPNWKLYISPYFNDLPEVFKISIPILSQSAAFSFKTGSTIQGLLRPDKMIVYFPEYQSMHKTGTELGIALKGFDAQGVPFTSQLNENGLLSWGVDPPRKDIFVEWEGGSWRTAIIEQLVLAIIRAKADKLNKKDIYLYLSQKLKHINVDMRDWTPLSYHNNS